MGGSEGLGSVLLGPKHIEPMAALGEQSLSLFAVVQEYVNVRQRASAAELLMPLAMVLRAKVCQCAEIDRAKGNSEVLL